MRVVLDSNVIIAAFATHGLCHLLMETCLENHRVLLSEFILEEVKDKLRNKIKLPENRIDDICLFLREGADLRDPGLVVRTASPDPDDDSIMNLADKGQADYVVTGDKALLELGFHGKSQIVSPREFADILRSD